MKLLKKAPLRVLLFSLLSMLAVADHRHGAKTTAKR